MRMLFNLLALGGFAWGANDFYKYMSAKRKLAGKPEKLQVWEGEGGAVPVAPTRTAAQTAPRQPSTLSARGDGV
jgi:hypothetical protein